MSGGRTPGLHVPPLPAALVVIAGVLLAAAPAFAADFDLISVSYGGCWGNCPVYRVTIHPDGSARYDGLSCVRIVGQQDVALGKDALRKIIDLIAQAALSTYDRGYQTFADGPSVTLSVTQGGVTKEITHSPGALPPLNHIEKTINHLVGVEDWIKVDDEWAQYVWWNNLKSRDLKEISRNAAGQETGIEPMTGLRFIHLPAGSFHFGCEPTDTACTEGEKPGRTVSQYSFWLGETPVTVAAYSKCVSAGACSAPETGPLCNWKAPGRANDPINCISGNQSGEFCAWIGARLPTELESEYAAKGGESRIYPWGNARPDETRACFFRSCELGTAPVDAFPAGATKQGVLDMAGDVDEWIPRAGARGGTCCAPASLLRSSSSRPYIKRAKGNAFTGFRCRM